MIEFARMPLPTPEPVRQSCRRSVVDRLADAICELGGSGEPVTEEALLARDFSPAISRPRSSAALPRKRAVSPAAASSSGVEPMAVITLTQTSRHGQPLDQVETVNLEAELEAETQAFEAIAIRTRATLAAIDGAGIFASAMHELALALSGLAFIWLAARIWTGI